VSLAVVSSILLGLFMLAATVGAWVGRRLEARLNAPEKSHLYGIEASLLALLALLLGFSFAMGETRYDLRKELVLDEANAIGTSRLRTSTIADDVGAEIRQILERYVGARLSLAGARNNDDIRSWRAECERLQREAFSRAARFARENPRSIPAGLLLQSLNEMIDLDTKRIGAARNHIPGLVLVSLVVVAMVAMGWVGAAFGSNGQHAALSTLVICAVITFVITVIIDLDQPRFGLIRVAQTPLTDLQRTFY
jgi:hypothetical protein